MTCLRKLCSLNAAILLSMTALSPAMAEEDGLVIGYAAAVTGLQAAYDSPDGVACRIAQINDAGGIRGKPVKLIVRDTKSDPVTAANVGQELLDLGADVLLGPPSDDMLIPIAQLALPAGVAVMSVASTQPAFPAASPDNSYLVAFGDNSSAAAAADVAYKAGLRRVVLMIAHDIGAYSSVTPEYFGKAFERLGGKVVGRVNYNHGLADYTPQITEIHNNPEKPDMVFAAIVVPDAGVLVRMMKSTGVNLPVYGTDSFDDPSFIDVAGPGADLATFITHGFPTEGSKLKQFYDDCQKRGYKIQNVFFGLGGEAVDVIKTATEAANSFKAADINAAAKNIENMQGIVADSITYKGRGGVPLKRMTVIRVKDGAFAPVETIVPSWVPEP